MAFEGIADEVWTKGEDAILDALQALPDKHIQNEHGQTLLHFAHWAGPRVVGYLLEQGLDPNAEDNRGLTPLHHYGSRYALKPGLDEVKAYLARAEKAPAIVNLLLDAGANPQRKDHGGTICYLRAAISCNCHFIRALADRGVELTHTDGNGNTGLHILHDALESYASAYQNAKESYERALAKNPEEYDNDPMFLQRHKQTQEAAGADLDLVLDAACIAAKAFLDGGVDPEHRNDDGKTPFELLVGRDKLPRMGAVLKGELTGKVVLAELSAEERLIAQAGGLTLQQAAMWQMPESIQARLKLGAEVNALDDIGELGQGTALAAACLVCGLKEAKLLLKKKADPNLKAGDGRAPVAWFFASAPERWPFRVFRDNYPGKMLKLMRDGGLDLNAPVDDDGNTPLCFACGAPVHDSYPSNRGATRWDTYVIHDSLRTLVIRELLKLGADVNIANRFGVTPLMIASAGYMDMYDEMQQLLLEKGADVSAKSQSGNTALIFSAMVSDFAHSLELAQNLFHFGDPLPGSVNNEGKTALDYAVAAGNEPLAKFLVEKTA